MLSASPRRSPALLRARPWPAGNRDLLSDANVRIDGAAAGDYSGFSVAGAGDVNGDGIDDLIVGAPSAGNNGRTARRSLCRLRHDAGFASTST